MPKVMLLEFNEICPPLLERWMAAGKLPFFSAFHRASQVFTTVSDETDPVNLEPWIQWYSLHTGLPFREHRVFHLTDGPKAGHADVWARLREAGKTVMNCSSMNAGPISGKGTFFLPDPWCTAQSAFPLELESFRKVVARAVQEYSRGTEALGWGDIVSFMSFLAAHGLTGGTAAAIVAQLTSERIGRRDIAWKRVALLDRLQSDVFRHYYRRMRPDFATFFVNSTAHLQHAYWRHMDPDPFTLKPSSKDMRTYGNAVLFGYQEMDRLLRDLTALADADTTVILCSALSQQPYLRRESEGGQHFYRLRDPDAFLAMIGVRPRLVEPVMTHQYVLRFDDANAAAAAGESLRAITLQGKQVFAANPSGEDALYVGCQLAEMVDGGIALGGLVGSDGAVRFADILYAIDATKSGRHHPDGVLWIRTGAHAVAGERVSILDVLPTIYALMEMGALASALPGASLVPRFGSTVRRERQAA